MVFGGDCLAKIDGKNVFVRGALPGETLAVDVIREERDYSVARIREVLSPSPHRVEPFCPLYGRCGGCSLQHCDSGYQRELRASMLADAFARQGIPLVPDAVSVVAGADTGYRARFQFHDGGLMARQSNEVVPLERCPCATDEINGYLAAVPVSRRPRGRVHAFGSAAIASLPPGAPRVVVAPERTAPVRASGKRRRAHALAADGGESSCTVGLLGKQISFDVRGFFQSNMEVLSRAIPLVTGGLSGSHALDLYAGAGTFSAFLADSFRMVTLVEHNREALVHAERNLAGTRHESFGVSGQAWALHHAGSSAARCGAFDAAVIDPPRAGMERAVSDWLAASGIPSVRSLSCDGATHARDAARLIKGGYRLEKLYLLDFYPQTCHVESLALFERERR